MLLGCLKKLKETEDMIRKKATDLWQSKIQTEKDVDLLLGEVESLVIVYDNLPPDIEDLRLMQRLWRCIIGVIYVYLAKI